MTNATPARPTGTTTVRDSTYALLERSGVTTIFGNPGSNELPFLAGMPASMRYVLALHEGAAVAMADGYAQASGELGVVNLHAASGTGNAMGGLSNAAVSRSPLLLLAGQQVRETVGQNVMLANMDAAQLTRPLTGYSAEPLAAVDVPRTLAEAIHHAGPGRRGPSFVSVPYDDWERPAAAGDPALLARTVTRAFHAAPEEVERIAGLLAGAQRPALVLGSDLDGTATPGALVALAEHLGATVHVAPSPYRLPFPNRHRLFAGVLPAGIRSIRDALAGHDLVLVLGAPVFRYHQYEPGEYLAEGTRLIQVTDDTDAAARAPFGETLLAEPAALVDGLIACLGAEPRPTSAEDPEAYLPCPEPGTAGAGRLHPAEVFAALRRTQPRDTAYVVESTSTTGDFWAQMDLREPGSYFWPASGGLGFGLPAAVGVALARPDRRVVGVIGDGSANYGITALWTAAQLRLPLTIVILRNGTYGALRWFADVLGTPDAPGLDIPDIDLVPVAEGYGVPGRRVQDLATLEDLLRREPDGPRLLQVETSLTTPH
ncbi:benzoylformate decarboxylase [Nocardioides insulae]|uniref:benzoylformate decarboxylase n=1 Tax=Nocardioides insulae TaxID=394734 RepID=UPI0004000AF0|nr:benzoylformate decarboxylase [Nocardioides insulae]